MIQILHLYAIIVNILGVVNAPDLCTRGQTLFCAVLGNAAHGFTLDVPSFHLLSMSTLPLASTQMTGFVLFAPISPSLIWILLNLLSMWVVTTQTWKLTLTHFLIVHHIKLAVLFAPKKLPQTINLTHFFVLVVLLLSTGNVATFPPITC